MDLERIAVTVRQREAWEAVDLGFALARKWWRTILAAWLIVMLPLAILAAIAFQEFPWLAFLLIWWLKPLFDRIPLAIISRAFFGEVPTPRRILTEPRRYLGRSLLGALTLRRLSPWRSYVQSIEQLEELSGTARTKRAAVITGQGASMAFFLTLLCLLGEQAVFWSLYILLVMLYPQGIEHPELFGVEAMWWAPMLSVAFYVVAMTLIEPFYVATGFALYINRRVEMEGWDIELGFRRMAARLQKLKSASAAAVLFTILTLPAMAVGQPPAVDSRAQRQPMAESHIDFAAEIEAILAGEEFRKTETREVWRLIDEKDANSEMDVDLTFFSAFGEFFSTLLVWSGGGLTITLLLYLTFHYWRRLSGEDAWEPAQQAQKPDFLFGLDLRRASLPDDVLAVARAQWARGEQALAMSLLYRGALSYVVERLRVDVPSSATEGECLEIVEENLGVPVFVDFELLTRAWQLIAYAKRAPSHRTFEELCTRWSAYLGHPA